MNIKFEKFKMTTGALGVTNTGSKDIYIIFDGYSCDHDKFPVEPPSTNQLWCSTKCPTICPCRITAKGTDGDSSGFNIPLINKDRTVGVQIFDSLTATKTMWEGAVLTGRGISVEYNSDTNKMNYSGGGEIYECTGSAGSSEDYWIYIGIGVSFAIILLIVFIAVKSKD